jgi:hypothetical protein
VEEGEAGVGGDRGFPFSWIQVIVVGDKHDDPDSTGLCLRARHIELELSLGVEDACGFDRTHS